MEVVAGKVNARQVCEALMAGLDFQHAEFWVQALGLVERLLPKLDYKGCRDVLKLIFEKVLIIIIDHSYQNNDDSI